MRAEEGAKGRGVKAEGLEERSFVKEMREGRRFTSIRATVSGCEEGRRVSPAGQSPCMACAGA